MYPKSVRGRHAHKRTSPTGEKLLLFGAATIRLREELPL